MLFVAAAIRGVYVIYQHLSIQELVIQIKTMWSRSNRKYVSEAMSSSFRS
jgi:hypothetical protein